MFYMSTWSRPPRPPHPYRGRVPPYDILRPWPLPALPSTKLILPSNLFYTSYAATNYTSVPISLTPHAQTLWFDQTATWKISGFGFRILGFGVKGNLKWSRVGWGLLASAGTKRAFLEFHSEWNPSNFPVGSTPPRATTFEAQSWVGDPSWVEDPHMGDPAKKI